MKCQSINYFGIQIFYDLTHDSTCMTIVSDYLNSLTRVCSTNVFSDNMLFYYREI